ncbi:MAG: hypothetical protein IT236_16100 [Bacteroidia bacterium]|nr:hypothetical protein [Bacteroidia bacterium]
MKKVAAYSFVLFSGCVLFCGWKSNSTLHLSEAGAKSLVKTSFKGQGGHSGKCVQLQLQNLKQSQLQLVLNSGDLLNSSDDEEQDLLVVHNQPIVLNPGETKTVAIEGYCCQLHNSSPGAGSGFKLDKTKNKNLKQLCDYLIGKPISPHLIQEAVWCISDDNNPANISDIDDGKEKQEIKDLRKFVCDLTKKEDPWYSTPQSRVVNESRQILDNPVEVFGNIKYTITTQTPVNAELRNEANEVVLNMDDPKPLPAGTFKYWFHLKIKGYPKGKYHVILKAGNEQILDKEFLI